MGYSHNSAATRASKAAPRHALRHRAGDWLVLVASLATAFAASAAPEDGQKFKDWTARCEMVEEIKEQRCYIAQSLVKKDDGKQLMSVAVLYALDTKKPTFFLTLPLGVLLVPGVALQVDGGEALRFPFRQCAPNGCLAALELTQPLVSAFKAGSQGRVSFHQPGAKTNPVTLPVSLNGFTAAFSSLR